MIPPPQPETGWSGGGRDSAPPPPQPGQVLAMQAYAAGWVGERELDYVHSLSPPAHTFLHANRMRFLIQTHYVCLDGAPAVGCYASLMAHMNTPAQPPIVDILSMGGGMGGGIVLGCVASYSRGPIQTYVVCLD